MGGVRVGILGTDAEALARSGGADAILGGGDPPGVLGVDVAIPLDKIQRSIAKVTQDRDDPSHTDQGAKPGVHLDTTIK
jgi:hypothetical protein